MTWNLTLSVLLADGWVGVIFFLIAIGGWIVNVVNQNQQPGKGARKPVADAGRRKQLQNEIDQFLNQTRRGPEARRDEPIPDREVEVVRPAPTRRPPPKPQKKRTKKEIWEEQTGKGGQRSQQQRSAQQSAPQKTVKPAPPVPTSRAVSRPPLEQTTATLPPRHSSSPATIGSAGKTLTDTRSAAETLNRRETAADRFRQMAGTPEGIRQAILINEILSRPLSLRPRR